MHVKGIAIGGLIIRAKHRYFCAIYGYPSPRRAAGARHPFVRFFALDAWNRHVVTRPPCRFDERRSILSFPVCEFFQNFRWHVGYAEIRRLVWRWMVLRTIELNCFTINEAVELFLWDDVELDGLLVGTV